MAAQNLNIVSADSHVMEPLDLWRKAIGNRFGDQTPGLLSEYNGQQGKFFYTGAQVLKIGQTDKSAQDIGFREAGFLPEVRIEFQKKAGVAAEVMNATFMLLIMQSRYHNVARAAAAVFNDWLAEFCAYDPKRLIGVSMIPMDDVDWAVAELERTTKKGLRATIIHLETPEGCPPYRDPIYDPFWARAQELGTVVTLHIITGRVPDPLHFHTKAEHELAPRVQMSLLYEVMWPLANEFIFGRILDRFPKLKLVTSEFEISWIPTFMWRLDQMQQDFGYRLELPKLQMKASDYLRHRIWHGLIDDPYAAFAIEQIGADRVLWGSDFPHVRSIGLDAQSRLQQLLQTLPPADRDKVVGGNATKVFGC